MAQFNLMKVEPKDFDKLKEHVNYLNVAWMVKQGIIPPEKAAEKAKKYQREYFEKKLEERRN